jgi:hypothetical protein
MNKNTYIKTEKNKRTEMDFVVPALCLLLVGSLCFYGAIIGAFVWLITLI